MIANPTTGDELSLDAAPASVGAGPALAVRHAWPPALVGGLVLFALLVAFAVAAPAFGDPLAIDVTNGFGENLLPVGIGSPGFPLGADLLGRNLLPRLAFATRTSLIVGLVANFASLALSLLVAIGAAFYRGPTEGFLMRLTDVFLAMPTITVAVFLAPFIPAGLPRIVLITTVVFWAYPARIFYGEALRLRGRGFVEGAEAAGAGSWRIMYRHILPHLFPLVLTYAPLAAASAVLFESALSFIGFGIPEPTPSLGRMIQEHAGYYGISPHLLFDPVVLIMLITLSFVLIGEGLKARNPQISRVSWLGA